MSKIILLVIVGLILVSGFQSAYSHGVDDIVTVDASSTGFDRLSIPLSQTFMANEDNLNGVSLILTGLGTPDPPPPTSITVTIKEGTNGASLESSTLVVAPFTTPLPFHFDFIPIPLNPGSTYTIQVIANGSPEVNMNILWNYNGDDSFPGQSFGDLIPADRDFQFRTFFDPGFVGPPPVIVGGTSIPIDTTSLLLAGATLNVWMITVVLGIVGAGIVLFKLKRK